MSDTEPEAQRAIGDRPAGAAPPDAVGRPAGEWWGGFLTARDVSKVFQTKSERVHALSSVSLSVAEGEFVSVLGPSGCGKSTLLSILCGLEAPSSGDVQLAGKQVKNPLPEMGVVFQRDLLLDWRTALDNVLLQYEMRGLDPKPHKARALDLLESVSLGGAAQRYPWQLSGGMRQRVSICRALIHEPKILLMDEPFGAVDALTRERLNVELSALCSEPSRKTVVFITHDIDEAVFLADRVLVMSARPGQIVESHDISLAKPRTNELRESTAFMGQVAHVRESLRMHGVLGP